MNPNDMDTGRERESRPPVPMMSRLIKYGGATICVVIVTLEVGMLLIPQACKKMVAEDQHILSSLASWLVSTPPTSHLYVSTGTLDRNNKEYSEAGIISRQFKTRAFLLGVHDQTVVDLANNNRCMDRIDARSMKADRLMSLRDLDSSFIADVIDDWERDANRALEMPKFVWLSIPAVASMKPARRAIVYFYILTPRSAGLFIATLERSPDGWNVIQCIPIDVTTDSIMPPDGVPPSDGFPPLLFLPDEPGSE